MKKLFLTIPLLLAVLLTGCCKDDDSPIPPNVSIHSADIAVGELLDLGQTVNFYYESTQTITQGTWTLEVLTENGDTEIIFTKEISDTNFEVTTPPFSNHHFYPGSTIDDIVPDRDDYLRTESGMLDVRVRLNGTFANGTLASAEYAIELPYRPSTPTFEVCGIEDDFVNWESSVTFCFNSLGATFYLIRRTPITGSHTSTNGYGADGNEYEKTIPYVYMDTEYRFSIRAYNQYGESKETTIMVGSNNPDYYLLTP